MKLTTKIAGSMALPLALAVAANSAQAFTVVDNDEHTITIGGYLSAITSWDKAGSKTSAQHEHKFNNQFSAGTSRLNLGYTDKATGTKFFYEQQFVGGLAGGSNGLRHAFFETADGLVGGFTWSFGTNNVARIETIEITNNSLVTDQHGRSRTLLLGQRFTVADGMKVGVSLEDQNNTVDTAPKPASKNANKSVLPGVTVNFDGQFGDARVFAAWTNYAVNTEALTATDSGKDKRTNRITLGTSIDAGAANIKLGLTHNFGVKKQGGAQVLNDMGNAKGTHVSGALGFKVNEKVRTNLAFEYSEWDKDSAIRNKKGKDGDASRVWLNAFYQADNGIEWGAEYQYADIDAANYAVLDAFGNPTKVGYKSLDKTLYDNGQSIRLQAKYAF